MTPSATFQIGSLLQLKLPAELVSAWEDFPFPRFSNTCEYSLYDVPDEIVRLTLSYREHIYRIHRPFICIGDDDDSAPYFYFLDTGEIQKLKGGNPSNVISQYKSLKDFISELRADYEKIEEHWNEIESEATRSLRCHPRDWFRSWRHLFAKLWKFKRLTKSRISA